MRSLFKELAVCLLGCALAPASWATEISHDYAFGAPSLSTVEWGGVSCTRVTIDGAPTSGNAGQPLLSGGSASLLTPYGEVVTGIQVTGGETLVGTGLVVEPAAKPFPISVPPMDENIPHRDWAVYGSSDPSPAAQCHKGAAAGWVVGIGCLCMMTLRCGGARFRRGLVGVNSQVETTSTRAGA